MVPRLNWVFFYYGNGRDGKGREGMEGKDGWKGDGGAWKGWSHTGRWGVVWIIHGGSGTFLSIASISPSLTSISIHFSIVYIFVGGGHTEGVANALV